MQRALALAHAASAAGEVPVGAVIVEAATGNIVGEGYNQPIAQSDPTAHAEIVAIRNAAKALENYRLDKDLHLYVTLEPCAMCAGAISFARISKLIFAAEDPKGGAVLHGGRFFTSPTCHWRPEIEQDLVNKDAAARLLKDFFKARRKAQISS